VNEIDGKEWLFDVARDPYELRDLSPEQPEMLAGCASGWPGG